MTSFLDTQKTRRGKWTAEEEMYAAGIMDAFNEGSLEDVPAGLSLRGYLAFKLRTNVKRISKKVSKRKKQLACSTVVSNTHFGDPSLCFIV